MNKKKKHKDWNETSCALHPFFFERASLFVLLVKETMEYEDEKCIWYAWERAEMHNEFGVSNWRTGTALKTEA